MMKFTAAILTTLLAQEALSFVPSTQPKAATTTALQAENNHSGNAVAAAAATTLLTGLSLLSSQAAVANDDASFFQQQQQQYATSISSSTITVAEIEIEQFTLPSYDSSKGTRLIDLSSEVETVNKKTLATAKAKREYTDKSAEKLEADALRRAEKEGGSLLDSMLGSAEKDNKAAIEAEKAESRANRWKTF